MLAQTLDSSLQAAARSKSKLGGAGWGVPVSESTGRSDVVAVASLKQGEGTEAGDWRAERIISAASAGLRWAAARPGVVCVRQAKCSPSILRMEPVRVIVVGAATLPTTTALRMSNALPAVCLWAAPIKKLRTP